MRTLEETNVVVVGGARGIGRAVAEGALERGASVLVIDVDAARMVSLRDERPSIDVARASVLDEEGLRAATARLARIDHVYVAAGRTQIGALRDGELEPQLEPLLLRLAGSAEVLRALAGKIPAGGSVTLTGGVSTDRPVKGAWVSSVATAATEQLARAMSVELAPIRVNAIAPGWTDTPMWDDVLGEQKADVFASVAREQPVPRIARPDEVALGVLFLMENGSVTGEVVHVDGGRRWV